MPRLSIVIPCWQSHAALESTLLSVLENRPADCEVLVVLRTGYADPYELAGEVRFVEADRGTDAVTLINQGIAASRGRVVHLLGCGAEVSEGWTEPALAHFADRRVAAVAPLLLAGRRQRIVESAGIEYHRSGSRVVLAVGRGAESVVDTARPILGPCLLAAFYRRTALRDCGAPFEPNVGCRHADVDLALRLRRAGYTAVLEPGCEVFRHEAGFPPESAFALARGAERLFWRHTTPPRRSLNVVRHLLLAAGDVLSAVPRPSAIAILAGRLWAACQRQAYRTCHAELAELEARAAALASEPPPVPAPHFATVQARARRR